MKRRLAVVAALVALLGGMLTPAAAEAAVPASVLTGQFIDAQTRAPLAGAKVYYNVNVEGGGGHTAVLDAHGRFRFVVNMRYYPSGVTVELGLGDHDSWLQETLNRGRTTDAGTIAWRSDGAVVAKIGHLGKGLGQAYGADLISKAGHVIASCYFLPSPTDSCRIDFAGGGRYAVRIWGDDWWSYSGNTALFEKAKMVALTGQVVTVSARQSTGAIIGTLVSTGDLTGLTASFGVNRVGGSDRDKVYLIDAGAFAIRHLPPGTYSMSVTLENFRDPDVMLRKSIVVKKGAHVVVGRLLLAYRFFQRGWA